MTITCSYFLYCILKIIMYINYNKIGKMKKIYLLIGYPGMGKSTLSNNQTLPVICYDKCIRNKERQQLKLNNYDYCLKLINDSSENIILFDFTNTNLKRAFEKFKDFDLVLVIMNTSKEKWKKNLLKRNKKYDIETVLPNIDIFYNKFIKLKETISKTDYKKIYITDEFMDSILESKEKINLEDITNVK